MLKLKTTSTPTVSGTAKVGSTLTAKAGTWAPAPVTLAYQWYRGSVRIAGATKSTYTVTAPLGPGTYLARVYGASMATTFNGPTLCGEATGDVLGSLGVVDLGSALTDALTLIRQVDLYINETAPFKLAKAIDTDPTVKPRLAEILYNCAETLRVASLLLSPALPGKMAAFWTLWNCTPPAGVPLAELAKFGGAYSLKAGQAIAKGEPLFMRADGKLPEPAPAV